MGWDGAGGYTRQFNFSADASSGIKILAARMDAELDDFASAMTVAWARNGQNVPTQDIPMGGRKFINVAAATSVGNYMRVREFIENVPIFMQDQESSADRISVSAQYFTSVSANQAPGDGTRILVRAGSDKSSAVMYLNGHSANVEFQGGSRAVNALVSGGIYEMIFSSADAVWKVTNPDDGRTAAERAAGVTPTNYQYEELNVKRYGAIGDGVTDDTTAISNAISVAGALSYRARVYLPRGQYLHSGLTIDTQGVGLRGDGKRESVLVYSGSGHGIDVTSGAHNVRISDLQLHGNANAASLLRWSAAANGCIERVHLSANGATADCFILQEASFYFRAVDCMIDGGGTAARGLLCQDNGAASGPNSSSFHGIRIQECTTAIDLTDGNDLLFAAVRLETNITTGFEIRSGVADVTVIAPRIDWTVNNSKGFNIDSGARRVVVLNPRNDISGTSAVLWSNSSTDSLLIEGNSITGSPIFLSSLAVSDSSDNPFIDLGTSTGTQRGLIQITGSLLDFFAATGFGIRLRTNGGANPALEIDTAGNVVVNNAAIATNATDGFLYVPSCAGTPTGTPTTKTGMVPIVVDSTNHKLYFYDGTWRDAGP